MRAPRSTPVFLALLGGLVGAGCGFSDSLTDTSAPAIAITSPADRSTVSGTVTIQVSAQDDLGVTLVTVRVDGQKLADLVAAPYQTTWLTTAAMDGLHSIEAVAQDASGNTARATIAVTVSSKPQ